MYMYTHTVCIIQLNRIVYERSTIVSMRSVGSLISLCSVNSIQTCNVALCKPKKCQVMSFMFQPLSFHVSGLVASTSTKFYIDNPEQWVQYNAKDCAFIAVVVFAIQACCLLPTQHPHTIITLLTPPTIHANNDRDCNNSLGTYTCHVHVLYCHVWMYMYMYLSADTSCVASSNGSSKVTVSVRILTSEDDKYNPLSQEQY